MICFKENTISIFMYLPMNSIRTKNGKYTSGVCLSYGSTVEKIPQEKFDWAKCGKAVLFWNSSGGSIVMKKKKLVIFLIGRTDLIL